jgi:hypothetical protein
VTERRVLILFKVLLFIVRGGLRNGASKQREDLEKELEKEIENTQFRYQQ